LLLSTNHQPLVGTKAKPIHRLGVGSTKKKAAFSEAAFAVA